MFQTKKTVRAERGLFFFKVELLWMKYVVGIDEVGRGSLAGPVVVAAVAATLVAGSWYLVAGKPRGKLRDSKKLAPKRREEWFAYIKIHPQVSYAVARVYPRTIERINISRAANLAAARAYRRLMVKRGGHIASRRIYLDGGLYIGKNKHFPNARTIVRGDEKFTAIKLASIVAKVSRDRLMTRLAKKHPQYGFEMHKGYGTEAHFAALRKHGPSEAHRLTFISEYHKK